MLPGGVQDAARLGDLAHLSPDWTDPPLDLPAKRGAIVRSVSPPPMKQSEEPSGSLLGVVPGCRLPHW